MFKIILVLSFATVLVVAANPIVHPELNNILKTKGSANIIIRMSSGIQQVLGRLNQINHNDRSSRLTTVANTLKEHSAQDQKHILDFLSSLKISDLEYRTLWITNEIFIASATSELVTQLANLPGILEIQEEYVFSLHTPVDRKVIPASDINPLAEEGIEKIQAHLAWDELGNNGAGAIVGHIDGGVRGTHEALAGNFVGDYGWFDAVDGALVPVDTSSDGHGTHTLGTIVGAGGIGVAPGAKWMSCRGCPDDSGCGHSYLARCAEFMACPTLADGSAADCSKAPHVINNSWGGYLLVEDPAYSFIQVWKAGGIVPVFSQGNDGFAGICARASSPADSLAGVIAVGASTFTDSLSQTSSHGPSKYGQIKPDISAPGLGIKSAVNTGDRDYGAMSGTSMASPHVAGVVALLKSESPELSYYDLTGYLYYNTDKSVIETGKNCGGVSESVFPNNAFGWGRVNAYKSVKALQDSLKQKNRLM